MTRNKMWFAALAISALAATSAYAAGDKMGGEAPKGSATGQVGNTSGSASFSELDKDSNGAIDSTEAAAASGLDFTNADADGDGRLSRSEFEAAVGKSGGAGSSPAPDGGLGK